NWTYLSDDQKKDHILYNKITAFFLFCVYLYIQFALSVFLLVSTVFNSREFVFLSNALPAGVLLWFLIVLGRNKKSKKTVKAFVIYLFLFPISYFLSKFVFVVATPYLDMGEAIQSCIGIVTLHILFGFIFLIYQFSSKAFNLQYLNRVKS
ncbi:hypothetical protein, partial [Acinetobacter ursingii]